MDFFKKQYLDDAAAELEERAAMGDTLAQAKLRNIPGRGEKKPIGAPPGADDLTSGIGYSLGQREPEKKYPREYINGIPTGRRKGPGIYLPPGADGKPDAFASGDPTEQVASFDKPKSAGELSYEKNKVLIDDMRPNERKNAMRRAAGLPARPEDESEQLERKLNVLSKFLGGDFMGGDAPKMPPGSPAPSGGGFAGAFAGGMGGAGKDLGSLAESAPALASLGGPPGSAPSAGTSAGGISPDMRQRLGLAMVSKMLGVDIPDARKIAREDDQYNFEKQRRDIELGLLRTKSKREGMTDIERMQETLQGIEALNGDPGLKTAMRAKLTGYDPKESAFREKQRDAQMAAFDRELAGDMAPAEKKKARIDAALSARKIASQYVAEGMNPREASQRALQEVNDTLRANGVDVLDPKSINVSSTFVNTSPKALAAKAQQFGGTIEDAYRNALMNVVSNDPSMKAGLTGRKLGSVDDRWLFQSSPIDDKNYQNTNSLKIIQALMMNGWDQKEAQAIVNSRIQ